MKNLFSIIRNQIIRNEVFGKPQVFRFVNRFYPESVIVFMTKQKAFKIDKIVKVPVDKGYEYIVSYKDVCTSCDFLDRAYEALKAKEEYKTKRGFYSNAPVSTKFLELNDIYRTELECKNYIKTGEDFYEYLDKADSCTFEIFLQKIGFENYDSFAKYIESQPKSVSEIIDEKYQEFLNSEIETRDYAENYIY